MTEYDYSPAAYERFLHTQNRVSNWVSQTKAHERQYSNPFVPSAFDPEQSPRPQRSRSSGSTSASSATVRPPQRSKTLDPKEFRSSAGGSSRHSRSKSFSSSQDTHSKPRSRSQQSHSRSQSYSYQPNRSYSSARPPMPEPIRAYSTPPGVVYKSYETPKRSVHITRPRPGEAYVIIPPPGRHVELVSPKGSVSYANSPRGHGHPHGGVYGVKEPLLKRLLGSIPWSNHGSQRGSTTGRGPRRRSSY